MDNNKNIFENIGKSIKTNYKHKIKKLNTKPIISRTKNLINGKLNNEPIKLINNPYQQHNQDNIKKYLTNNQSEESYSSFYRNDQNSSNIKRKEHEKTKRVIKSNYQEPKPYKKQLNNYNAPKDNWTEMLYHPTEKQKYGKKSNKLQNISK